MSPIPRGFAYISEHLGCGRPSKPEKWKFNSLEVLSTWLKIIIKSKKC